jgi:hypothetical protein
MLIISNEKKKSIFIFSPVSFFLFSIVSLWELIRKVNKSQMLLEIGNSKSFMWILTASADASMKNWEKAFSVSMGEGMGIDDEKSWLTLTHINTHTHAQTRILHTEKIPLLPLSHHDGCSKNFPGWISLMQSALLT